MKLLVLSTYYPPYSIGGYEVSCKTVVDYLAQQGHELCVLTSDYGEAADAAGVLRRLRMIDYTSPSYLGRLRVDRHNYTTTRAHIAAFMPDAVYIWNQARVGFGPSLAAEASGLPVLYDFGDRWPNAYVRRGVGAAVKRHVKQIIPFAVGGVPKMRHANTVSDWMARELSKTYGTPDMQVIRRPVAVPPAWPDRAAGPPWKFIFAGRLDRPKGLHLALEAFAKLGRAYDGQWRFRVVGEGEPAYEQECKALAHEAGLARAVQFMGRREQGQVLEMLRSHDVLLVPSMWKEPIARVGVEGMASGAAVVGPDRYGPSEYIEHGEDGMLFKFGDAESLAAAIRELLDAPERIHEMGRRAHAKALREFDTPVIGRRSEQRLLGLCRGLA